MQSFFMATVEQRETVDVWVNRTEANYNKIVKAFQDFGMPVFDMSRDKFMSYPDVDVFSFGVW